MTQLAAYIKKIDDKLSRRPIKLDPGGYFIIYIDREAKLNVSDRTSAVIEALKRGLAQLESWNDLL